MIFRWIFKIITKHCIAFNRKCIKSVAKSVLIALGLTAATSATDVAIHKKMFVSSATVLLISNEEMNDTMQLVKSLEESGLLINSVIQIIKNELKEQNQDLLEYYWSL